MSDVREQVYVELLDEGIRVWRPVKAQHITGDIYRLEEEPLYDPADEHWQFPPGTIVACEMRQTSA